MDGYQQKKVVLLRLGVTLVGIILVSCLLVILFYVVSGQMGTMLFALLIGAVGACFSFFLRFPRFGKQELEFSRPEIAEGEALSLKTALEIRPVSVQDFGKLLVWCFLAGYSERLVPNILQSLEGRATDGEAEK